MKTNIIRCATLLVVMALSLNASAQKNVLKAFEKFKSSKGVTITNTIREQGKTQMLNPWRCNIVEFKVFKGAGVTFKMKELQDAFEQDSQDADVTYYGQMKGLSEKATEAEKAKYKKTIVRYNDEDDPIVIGENTTYNVLVLRSNSKEHARNRIVVAVEWKMDNQSSYCIGNLYEIEGPNDYVRTTMTSAAGENVEVDDFITRMNFYRDNYTKGSGDDRALLMSMLTYLTANAPMASENEKAVARSILGEMGQDSGEVSPTMVMNQNIILQCLQVLDPKQEFVAESLVMERLNSYFEEWRRETIFNQQEQVMKRMAEYIRAQQEKGMSEATFNKVVSLLGGWKSRCTMIAQKEFISGLLTTMERKQNGME